MVETEVIPPSEPTLSEKRQPLRWPLQLQLLLPLLLLVLLTCGLTTAVTSFWIARRVQTEQADALARAARTLSEATFPLSNRILEQMKGLSGADFVLLSPDNRVQGATLDLQPTWLAVLSHAPQLGPQPAVLGTRRYLVDRVKLTSRSPSPGTLLILAPEDELSSRVRQAVLPAIASGALATVVSMALATWLARRFATPIRRLVRQTAAISSGQFDAVPVPARNDEFRDLTVSINDMSERLSAYETQVRQHERLRSMGELAAAMGHQLRNTATGGRLALELHQQQCADGASDESLTVAMRQLRLLESHVRQFLAIGNQAPVVPRDTIDLAELLDETLGLLGPMFDHAGVELQVTRPPGPIALVGDRDALRQLMMNLLLNAADAVRASEAPLRRVSVELSESDGQKATLVVRDSGEGPEPAIHDRLFQSFVTTKANGVGLGLYCARQIAESHGGRLVWERRDNLTVFRFEFSRIECEHGTHPGRR